MVSRPSALTWICRAVALALDWGPARTTATVLRPACSPTAASSCSSAAGGLARLRGVWGDQQHVRQPAVGGDRAHPAGQDVGADGVAGLARVAQLARQCGGGGVEVGAVAQPVRVQRHHLLAEADQRHRDIR